MSLEKHIADHVECGCRYSNGSLGIQDMPPGYALMLDADELYYYWLRADGVTSDIHWSQWAIRKGAIADAAKT